MPQLAHIQVFNFKDITKAIKEQVARGYSEFFTEGSYKQGFFDVVMKDHNGDTVLISWKR